MPQFITKPKPSPIMLLSCKHGTANLVNVNAGAWDLGLPLLKPREETDKKGFVDTAFLGELIVCQHVPYFQLIFSPQGLTLDRRPIFFWKS
jgi:hypothetical protein